ncbi:MAG: hypothetical protein J2P57_10655 [Acidimicrobiaceae bacterium]|nr:hypothetical protein [Acidimicrobiaceae bacterium]
MALFRHDVRITDKQVRPAGRQGYRTALAPALRRVDGVRLWVSDSGCRAEVYGLGHRHPVHVRVSVALARELAEAGAPCDVRVEPDCQA